MYSQLKHIQLEEHIQADLNLVVSIILENFLDSSLPIWLFGGYGRGEGGAVRIEGKYFPANNYDLLLIARNPIEKLRLSRKLADCKKALATRIKNTVDLSVITQSALQKNTMLAFDASHASVKLNGKTPRDLLGQKRPEGIDTIDAINILRNRTLLYILANTEQAGTDRRRRLLAKFIIAFIDAICIVQDTKLCLVKDKLDYASKRSNRVKPEIEVTEEQLALFNLAVEYRFYGSNGQALEERYLDLPSILSPLLTDITQAITGGEKNLQSYLSSNKQSHILQSVKRRLKLWRSDSSHPLLRKQLYSDGTLAILCRVFTNISEQNLPPLSDRQLITLHMSVFE